MSTFIKLIKYRKFLNKQLKTKSINFKYILICDFNNFNGLGLKLLKLFIQKKQLKFKLYKKIFSNFYINLKYINNKLIYFKFNKFFNIIYFIKFLKNFTLIPFFCYPLIIINKQKNIFLPITKLNTNLLIGLNKINLIQIIFIKFIKNLLITYVIKLLLKLKKCQL